MNTKRMMFSLLAGFVITGFVLIACVSQTWAAEPSRPWTTIGSAGTVGSLTTTCPRPLQPILTLRFGLIQIDSCSSPAAPPILEFVGATVSLPLIPGYSPPISPIPTLYNEKAVIRYNVAAADGLFQSGDSVRMKVRFLDTGENSQLIARLIELNLQSGAPITRLTFNSNLFAGSSSYQQEEALTSSWSEFDFGQNAYYIEVTLTRSFYRMPGSDSAPSLTDIVGPGLESIQLEKISH